MSKRTQIFMPVLLILAILTAVFLFWFKGLTGRIFVSLIDPVVATDSTAPKYANPIVGHFSEYIPFNILLLGYGGGQHDGTYLTDSIINVRIDPASRKITLISLPRDLWVNLPGGSSVKINSVFSSGLPSGPAAAGKSARDAAAQVLGFPVDYFVSLDFAGFTKAIDAIGGVDILVDTAFTDYQYPLAGKETDLCGRDPAELPAITASASATVSPQDIFPCRYETLHFDKGLVHMDGATALKYVRSRHSLEDGSDFGRSRRQKNLLLAVKQKVLSLNFLPKSLSFMDSLGDSVRTDLSLEEARELLSRSSQLADYTVESLVLTDENVLTNSTSSDRQFILIPKTGAADWQSVHQWLAAQLAPTPAPSPTSTVH